MTLSASFQTCPPDHAESPHGTLILVGYTVEGITVSADSLSRGPNDKSAQKLFPFGSCGAIAFAGNTKVMTRKGKMGDIVDEIDLVAISRSWMQNHPKVDAMTGNASLSQFIKVELTEFFNKHKTSTSRRSAPFFHTIVVGYVENKPVLFTNSFTQPVSWGSPVEVEGGPRELNPGDIFMFAGAQKVCNELIEDKTDALNSWKAAPPMKSYRGAKRNREGYKLTLKNLVEASDICLKATESTEGRAFDPEASTVAPPNWFATVTPNRCFRWEQPPPQLYSSE